MTQPNGSESAPKIGPAVAAAAADLVADAERATPTDSCTSIDVRVLDFEGLANAVRAGQLTREAARAEWDRREAERSAELAARRAAEQAATEAATRAAAVEASWSRTGIPPRHAARVEELRHSAGPWAQVYGQLRSRLDSGFIVGLIGSRGTGKTAVAACLCREVCEAHPAMEPAYRLTPPALYVRAVDIFRRVRDTYRRECDETEADVIRALVAPRLLVIDEAHERGHSEFENRVLVEVIDRRYGEMDRDVLLIANMDKVAFAESVGNSIVSRMQECGRVVVCEWSSFRTPAAAEGKH
ncbi:MAG: ATP-binding protein [Planctomycetota bacterium]